MLLSVIVVTGCVPGVVRSVTVGPSFGDDATAIVAAVEVGVLTRTDFDSERALGLSTHAQVGGAYDRARGGYGFVAGGVDYLPFLYRGGTMVGMGGAFGYARGAEVDRLIVVAPRLWFVVPVRRHGRDVKAAGAMLRCEIAIGDDDAGGCGPALVLSWIDLGRQ